MRRTPLLLLVLLCACDPDAVPFDAGTPHRADASSSSDTGTVGPDAGQASPDGGTVSSDASVQADAGTVPGCAENPPVAVLGDPRKTDNACILERWQFDLAGRAPAEQRTRIEAYLARDDMASNLPLRGAGTAIFIADAKDGAPKLAGSFNAWDPAKGDMTPLLASGYAFRREVLAPGRHAYKFVYGLGTSKTRWLRDAGARWVEWDGIKVNGVGEFNSVVYTGGAALDRGLLRLLPNVASPELGNARDVFVYVPKGAFDGTPRYPSLYVHDGNEMLARSQMDTVSDGVFNAGKAKPAVIVFVPLHDQTERMAEYTFGSTGSRGDKYRTFLADTLSKRIDLAFPTLDDPRRRGLAGASLGGLISAYVAFYRPDRFGLVGSQSGSFFWPEPNQELLTKDVGASPLKPIRFYVDNGSPGDNDTWNDNFVAALKSKGYDHVHIVEPGAKHDWYFWAGRWPKLLAFLFPP
jgi:enterochelin esterase family protein